MTTSAAPRHAWVDVIDLEDTVIYKLPGDATTVRLRITPRDTTPRDTDAAAVTERISFGVVGSRPEPPIGVTRQRIYPTPPRDALQERFDRFAAGGGRHRAPEPGLPARLFRALGFGRLFGRGRKDGA